MRILVIGDKNIKGATRCVNWAETSDKIPTLGDYEYVFINLESMNIAHLAKLNVRNFALKIVEALRAHTKIYCLTAAGVSSSGIYTYSMFPFNITTSVGETGEAFEEEINDEYFRKVKRWDYFLIYQGNNSWEHNSILRTRHKHDVSLTVALSEYGTYGFIQFYPPQTLSQSENSFKNLFKYKISEDPADINLPEFIEEIPVVGENELIAKIEADKKSMQALVEQVKESSEKLIEIKSKKGILAFKGKPLERSVAMVLKDLGLSLSGTEVYEEDGMLELEGNSIPVEIKGHDKGMGIDDVRQIIQRGSKAKTKPEVPVKGILIGNPYAEFSLEKRGKDFEPNIIKAAEPFAICLLSTKVLFDYWRDYLAHGKSTLAKKILTTVGVLKYEPYKKTTPEEKE